MTDNLNRRLAQHLKGKVAYTKGKLSMELIHVECCKTRKEARKLEKFFKSGCGREIIQEIAEVLEW